MSALTLLAQAGAAALRQAAPPALALGLATLAGAQSPTDAPPPLPEWRLRPDASPMPTADTADFSWPGLRLRRGSDPIPVPEVVLRRWNPATGITAEQALGLTGVPGRATAMPSGVLFDFRARGGSDDGVIRAVLAGADGRILRSAALVERSDASWVVLADRSAVLIGGRVGGERSLAVERVRQVGTELVAERLPDLPGLPRHSFATVALADGRLMVLGGSPGRFRGCLPCQAESHILDPATRLWQPGPVMLQERAGHTATRLPDGSVLVAGGWTPKEDWSAGPSRSTERWRPGELAFTADVAMVNGSAEHEAVWMPGQVKPLLLVAGGTSTAIQAFTVDGSAWTTVGASARGSRNGTCAIVPFMRSGRGWLWRHNRSEPQYGPGECNPAENHSWVLTPLRLASDAPAVDGSAALEGPGVMLDRSGTAFVPARAHQPALVIGGSAGEDARTQSAAVDAITTSDAAAAYPTLQQARVGAKAVRLANGVLVVGGFGGAHNQRREDAPPLPAEWLPDTASGSPSQWVELAGVPGSADALGTDSEGKGLVLSGGNQVHRIAVAAAPDGRLRAEQMALPPLNRARSHGGNENEPIQIRGLADGRIIVAGGLVQSEMIALLRPDSDQPTALDQHLGIGAFLPSRRHETFDPVQRVWRNSAPSRAAGGHTAILDDGRVVKFAVVSHPPVIDQTGREIKPGAFERVFEISSADGTRWHDLADKLPAAVRRGQRAGNDRPFVVDGELLMATQGAIDIGGAPSLLLWLNTASGRWETLWEARERDNWRAHVGRHIVRRLANGKRIVIPVGGF